MHGACIICGEPFDAETASDLKTLIETHRRETHTRGRKRKEPVSTKTEEQKPAEPQVKDLTVKQTIPTIYVLAEQIPANPEPGQKVVQNVVGKLGYHLEKHVAEAAATRHNLVAIVLHPAVNPGEQIP